MFGQSLMVAVALLGVLGLIFLTWAGTKWLNKKFRFNGIYGTARGIALIECIGIAPDKQLMVVKVGKRLMLLGVTPGSVTKLCDLDEEDIDAFQTEDAAPAGFLDKFKKAFAARTLKNEEPDNNETAANQDWQDSENDF